LLDCLLAALVFFGIILIIPEFTLSNNLSRGVFAGIFSALTFSLRNIIQRKYISHYPGTTIILYQLIVIIILLLPFARFKNPLPDHNNLVLLVVLGIFFTALPHSLFAFGLNNLKAKTVSIIASLQPAYATLFAFLVLGEIPDGKVILGGMIIVSCAVFESLSQSNR
jgi:drug/metabolite transporter (DMT)-like permease